MKFPISREKLQNIKKDVEDNILEHNIDLIVKSIQRRVIVHAYSFYPNQNRGGAIYAVAVNYNDPWRYNPTKLKIDIPERSQIIIPDNLIGLEITSSAHSLASFNPWKTHFEIIKEKLMELFPGVSFETDPLKTYMLIDWS